MKKIILSAIVLSFTVIGAHAQKSATFVADGKAIKGYDPVAFFTESRAVRGQDSLMYGWNGADWLFSSRANLDRFRAEPEKYAPQYGGYCAAEVAGSGSVTVNIDPEAFAIIDGKLYLTYDKVHTQDFAEHASDVVPKANAKWPKKQAELANNDYH